MIGRNEWTAQPPDKDQIPLNLPVDRLIIAHTNTTSCDTQVRISILFNPVMPNKLIYFRFCFVQIAGTLFVNRSKHSS